MAAPLAFLLLCAPPLAVGDRVVHGAYGAGVVAALDVGPGGATATVRLDRPLTRTEQGRDARTADLEGRIARAVADARHYERRAVRPDLETGWRRATRDLAALRAELDDHRRSLLRAVKVSLVDVPVGELQKREISWFVRR